MSVGEEEEREGGGSVRGFGSRTIAEEPMVEDGDERIWELGFRCCWIWDWDWNRF